MNFRVLEKAWKFVSEKGYEPCKQGSVVDFGVLSVGVTEALSIYTVFLQFSFILLVSLFLLPVI